MRLPALLVLPALAMACSPPSADRLEGARSRIVAQVQAVTDSLTAAMNAHEVDRILGFFDLGPDFVYASCTEFLFGGDLFANVTRSYHTARKDVTYDIQVVRTQALGGSAALVVLQTESSDPGASNPVLTTRALSRGVDGRWRIVYQHQSWPACSSPRPPHPMTSGAGDDEPDEERDPVG